VVAPAPLLRHGREILTEVMAEVEIRAARAEQPGRTVAGGPRRGGLLGIPSQELDPLDAKRPHLLQGRRYLGTHGIGSFNGADQLPVSRHEEQGFPVIFTLLQQINTCGGRNQAPVTDRDRVAVEASTHPLAGDRLEVAWLGEGKSTIRRGVAHGSSEGML